MNEERIEFKVGGEYEISGSGINEIGPSTSSIDRVRYEGKVFDEDKNEYFIFSRAISGGIGHFVFSPKGSCCSAEKRMEADSERLERILKNLQERIHDD